MTHRRRSPGRKAIDWIWDLLPERQMQVICGRQHYDEHIGLTLMCHLIAPHPTEDHFDKTLGERWRGGSLCHT